MGAGGPQTPPIRGRSAEGRCPVKRSGSIPRKTPLRRGTWLRRPASIRPRSDKQRALDALWAAVVSERRRLMGDRCEVRRPDICWGNPTTGHHVHKRSRGRVDTVEHCRLACPPCHQWIEDHDLEAQRLGFSVGHKVTGTGEVAGA
jgi:hypothetical protein